MKLRVTHVEGSKKGSVDNFDAPVVTVGRDPSNVLAFDPVKDDRVSTKHAALSEQGGQLIVTDLGSRNGTIVNGQKISGPTPVPSGGLIQFGDNGPMIMVAYESGAAPAAAPAPAPAKKGGGGGACVVVLLLLVMLVVVGGGGLWFFVLRGHHGGGGWSHVAVGSTFEFELLTKMEKPVAMETKTQMKQSVVSRTEENVHVKTDTTMTVAGTTNTSTSEVDYPLHQKVEGTPEKPVEEKDESVTVPAGTFKCHYTKTKKDDTTTELWMSDECPLPVKTVSTKEGLTSTMTLVKMEKK